MICTQDPTSQSYIPPPLTIKRWAVLGAGNSSSNLLQILSHLPALILLAMREYLSSRMAATMLYVHRFSFCANCAPEILSTPGVCFVSLSFIMDVDWSLTLLQWTVTELPDGNYTLLLENFGRIVYIQSGDGNVVGSDKPPTFHWTIVGQDGGPYTLVPVCLSQWYDIPNIETKIRQDLCIPWRSSDPSLDCEEPRAQVSRTESLSMKIHRCLHRLPHRSPSKILRSLTSSGTSFPGVVQSRASPEAHRNVASKVL